MVVDVDILVDKVLEIMNTDLIRVYCEQDERFMKVALVLKAWNRNLSSDKSSRLNSFSIYILLLAYMLFKHMLVNVQRSGYHGAEARLMVFADKTPKLIGA